MSRVTRARMLRVGLGAVAGGTLIACGAPATDGTGRAAATNAPAAPARRETTLMLGNDWTSPDRRKIIEAWVARANRVYPHIKTDLADNADTQEKLISQFAAD